MSGMIIRTPTRTKTKSFNGKQMDFTFPSPVRGSVDEHSLDNHRIVNETLSLKPQEDIEVSSQMLSDYTSSASNANTYSGNSSNGYYSFANISDNTTASPKVHNHNNMVSPILENTESSFQLQTVESLDPQRQRIRSTYEYGHMGSNQNLRQTREKSKTAESISTTIAQQTIPTADNISFDFSDISGYEDAVSNKSENKNHKPQNSVVKNQLRATSRAAISTNDSPSQSNVYMSSLINSSLESTRKTSTASSSVRSSRSSLKRSNAVRCKGGLLQYFTKLGIKIRKNCNKLRLVMRRKLFRFKKNSKSFSRSNSIRSGLEISKLPKVRHEKKLRQESSSIAPHTLHQKRTHGFNNKLHKSMSLKSLQPALVSETVPEINNNLHDILESKEKTADVHAATKTMKTTPSLRRTPSSIRRAASILTSNVATPKASANNRNSMIEYDTVENSRISSRNSSIKSKGRLVRSSGSVGLSSIARQPSIVVKNKVIPLSMSRFSIKEEIKEEEEESEESTSDYYVETEPVEAAPRTLAGPKSYAPEHFRYGANVDDIKTLYKHYLSTVISRRIKMRLEMAQGEHSATNEPALTHQSTASLKDPIASVLTEYDSEGSEGTNLFDDEDDSSASEEDDEVVLPPLKGHNSTMSFVVQSPFTRQNSMASSSALLYLPVKRSLTLPIGMKIT